MQDASNALKKAEEVVCERDSCEHLRRNLDLAYFDSIARLRFGLSVTAEICHDYIYDSHAYNSLVQEEKTAVDQLITKAKEICTGAVIRDRDHPRHFLIKELAKQYGFTCLMKISEHHLLQKWLLPTKDSVSSV